MIYNENLSELSRKDIGEFSRVQKETGEKIPEENGMKKTIDEKPIETITEKLQQYWWILAIILVILVAYLFYSLNKKK